MIDRRLGGDVGQAPVKLDGAVLAGSGDQVAEQGNLCDGRDVIEERLKRRDHLGVVQARLLVPMGDHIQADVLAVCGEHADDAPIRGQQALDVDEEVLLAREASPEVLNDDQIVTLARHLAQAVGFEVDVGAQPCRGALTRILTRLAPSRCSHSIDSSAAGPTHRTRAPVIQGSIARSRGASSLSSS